MFIPLADVLLHVYDSFSPPFLLDMKIDEYTLLEACVGTRSDALNFLIRAFSCSDMAAEVSSSSSACLLLPAPPLLASRACTSAATAAAKSAAWVAEVTWDLSLAALEVMSSLSASDRPAAPALATFLPFLALTAALLASMASRSCSTSSTVPFRGITSFVAHFWPMCSSTACGICTTKSRLRTSTTVHATCICGNYSLKFWPQWIILHRVILSSSTVFHITVLIDTVLHVTPAKPSPMHSAILLQQFLLLNATQLLLIIFLKLSARNQIQPYIDPTCYVPCRHLHVIGQSVRGNNEAVDQGGRRQRAGAF